MSFIPSKVMEGIFIMNEMKLWMNNGWLYRNMVELPWVVRKE